MMRKWQKTYLLEQKIQQLQEAQLNPIPIIPWEEVDRLWNESDVNDIILPPCCSPYEFYRDKNGKIRRI